MKRFKNSIFYIGIIGGFSVLIYLIILAGAKLEQGRKIVTPKRGDSEFGTFTDSLVVNLQHPLAILLAQVVTIILAARIFGWIFKKTGQPAVIGEIIAGIVLGPSLMGLYFPEFSAILFPPQSLGNLQFLSQIGLILFMFVVGMELDLKILKNKANDAVVISHASIVIPFALGIALAFYIYHSFAPAGVQFISFGLFLGIAMSITAFPVLARIVQERGIHKTRLGTIVITCAAADDITAWCILAVVIAIVKAGSFVSSLYVIGLAATYVVFMIKVVRPFLKRVGDLHASRENLSKPIVAIFFITLILSAYATEVIGIHALFGAFMAGAIMPDNSKFRNLFIEKVEDIALVLLLPLFFVFTGLRTEIGLLNDSYLWKVTGLIILVAVTGKFIGSALAAKFVGQTWKDSLTIGALMNTRGLMELIVLNIGYDLGVLTPSIFAMMVIMALATTFMTGPALNCINRAYRKQEAPIKKEPRSISRFKILLSFGNPETGSSLLRFANGMVKKLNGNTVDITTMHLSPSNELNQFNIEEYEKESFEPIIQTSIELNQKITTLFKPSSDIDSDITEVANKGEFDLLLIGAGQSIFEGSLLGKILGFTTRIISPDRLINQVTGKEGLFEHSPFVERTRVIVAKSRIPVGILIDKGFAVPDKLLLPIFSLQDVSLIKYARILIANSGSQVTILAATGDLLVKASITESLRSMDQNIIDYIVYQDNGLMSADVLKEKSLVLISSDSWKKLVDSKNSWLAEIPSTLIIAEK